MDVIEGEVWGDAVAYFPASDVFANCHDLPSAVGAGNNIFLLAVEKM